MKKILATVLLAVSLSVVTGCGDHSYGSHEVEWPGGSCTGDLKRGSSGYTTWFYIVCQDGTAVNNLTNFKVVK